MENNPPLIEKYSQAGSTEQVQPVTLPDTGALKRKRRYNNPNAGIVAALNANRDLNTAHDFEYFSLRDAELMDYSAFNEIHRKVLANRERFSNFSGNPQVDFTNLSPAEIQFYSDFLGINFKKIGHALGSAATSVGHAVRGAGLEVAHGVRDVAVAGAHGIRAVGTETGHLARGAGLGIAHGVRAVGTDVGHGARAVFKEGVHLHQIAEKDTAKVVQAVKPYWKEIATVAAMAALIATGVGIPAALALGGTLLTGLNSIPADQQVLPPGFGSGGYGGMDGGGGFPAGATDPENDPDPEDTDDTGEGLTPEDVARDAQAQAVQGDEAMQAQVAAEKKKKLIMYGGAIVAVIAIYWFFIKK